MRGDHYDSILDYERPEHYYFGVRRPAAHVVADTIVLRETPYQGKRGACSDVHRLILRSVESKLPRAN